MISLIELSKKRKHLVKQQFKTLITTTKTMEFLNIIKPNFLLVGGHATSLYMPNRQTSDIDIIINKDYADSIHNLLLLNNAIYATDLIIGGKSYIFNNEVLDVIYEEPSFYNDAFKLSKEAFNIRVVCLSHLVVMKLKASRVQDLADIAKMLGYASNKDIDLVKRTVNKYLPNDLEDLESLIQLGKHELSN